MIYPKPEGPSETGKEGGKQGGRGNKGKAV
jgi:hypothetical protein